MHPKWGVLGPAVHNAVVCAKCGAAVREDELGDHTHADERDHATALPEGGVEELEAKMAAATKAIVAKKPAKAVKKKGGGAGPMKRPAAVWKLLPNGEPDMSDVFTRMNESWTGDISRDAFCCRAYGPAETRARKSGFSEPKMKAFRKKMYEKASKLFDTLSG